MTDGTSDAFIPQKKSTIPPIRRVLPEQASSSTGLVRGYNFEAHRSSSDGLYRVVGLVESFEACGERLLVIRDVSSAFDNGARMSPLTDFAVRVSFTGPAKLAPDSEEVRALALFGFDAEALVASVREC